MSLSGHLAEKFRADIRFRGEAYLKSERVEIIRVTADEVHAIVHDSVDYQTPLSRVEEKLQIFCSCSAGATAPVYCKHLWATLLSVEEGDLITGRVKEGIVPPFTYSTPELDLDDEDWDDDHPLDSLPPQRSSRTATKARKPPQQEYTKLRAWEEQLKSIREEMDPMITGATKGGREREIVYEVDVEKSSETGTLVVQTSQRQRRANGQWGKVNSIKSRTPKTDNCWLTSREGCPKEAIGMLSSLNLKQHPSGTESPTIFAH